jgi:hypothetical protein
MLADWGRRLSEDLLDQATLLSLLHYDPETGIFTWLKREEVVTWVKLWNGRMAGKAAGSYDSLGYLQIELKLNGKRKAFMAHRAGVAIHDW